MQYEDIELTCIQCGEKFVLTKSEQQQWARRGFIHRPKRCRKCREERRAGRMQGYYHSKDQDHTQNIYRAPAFRNEDNYQSAYRSPMERERQWRNPPRTYEITCHKCGEKDTIPFKPAPGRNVYCHKCHAHGNSRKEAGDADGAGRRSREEAQPEEPGKAQRQALNDHGGEIGTEESRPGVDDARPDALSEEKAAAAPDQEPLDES
jgi:CxxC-x17-CxxC domain-containing protein